jgi:hypothetical protein
LVNLPIGLAGLWLSWRYVTETTRSPQREFDLPGQIAAIVSLGCLARGIIEGGARPWSDDFVIAGFGRILAESAAKVMGSPTSFNFTIRSSIVRPGTAPARRGRARGCGPHQHAL